MIKTLYFIFFYLKMHLIKLLICHLSVVQTVLKLMNCISRFLMNI